jgi:hypothetical protein
MGWITRNWNLIIENSVKTYRHKHSKFFEIKLQITTRSQLALNIVILGEETMIDWQVPAGKIKFFLFFFHDNKSRVSTGSHVTREGVYRVPCHEGLPNSVASHSPLPIKPFAGRPC